MFMMISFLARSAVVVIVGLIGDVLGLKSAFTIAALIGFSGLCFVFKLPTDDRCEPVDS
jgi:FSR family fosmidomycin resistance protein-like MFS transporter